jgi:predicted house-cleaning noncanonical NTP pyrophosphatase (MazG superfamily)
MYKLIRDLIPNIIQQTEGVCNYAEVKNDEFYYALLQDKLIEEVNEYLATGDVLELVDIITVIKYIADVAKVDLKELYEEKLKTNGGFDKRLVGFFQIPNLK